LVIQPENTQKLNLWIKQLSSKYGKLSGAVLSAGIQIINPMRAVNQFDLREIFTINFEANFWLAKGFCDKRVNAGKGD